MATTADEYAKLSLDEIAERIGAYLERFADDPELQKITISDGRQIIGFYAPNVHSTGRRIFIREVIYQGEDYLSKEEGLTYLKWLDAGNVGKHRKALGPRR